MKTASKWPPPPLPVRLGGFLLTNKGAEHLFQLVLPGATLELLMCKLESGKGVIGLSGKGSYLWGGGGQLKETSVHSEVWSWAESQLFHFFFKKKSES